MLVAWLLFPVVVVAVSLGCGLLVEWASGAALPGAIVVSAGLALVIVATTVATTDATTAGWATPLVLVLGVAGYVLRWSRLRALRFDAWALGVGIGVFLVCAAPMVLSGNATFLGYFVLNDGVFHFSLIHQLLAHGHDVSGLAPSSYSSLVRDYLSTSYPTGADLPIGALRPLVGQDVAWLFQPEQAVMMALGAAALYELLTRVIAPRPLRALAAFVAAQAGLLYAYYLEASIKELATTWLISVTVVLVFSTLRRELHWRRVIPLLVVAIAGYDVLGAAIAPWLGPPLVVFVAAVAWRLRTPVRRLPRRRLATGGAAGVIVVGGLGFLLVRHASRFLSVAQAVLTQPGVLGNLVSPLPKWEMFGIWPVGDFRFPVVEHYRLTYALIGVVIASGALGTLWAVRRRRFEPLVLLAGNAIAAAYLLSRADPYAGGKVMMIFSLTSILVAMLGPASLHDSGRRVEAWALAGVIAAGVLWTNALGYHDASVAPRDRLQELSTIDARFAGQGPAFYNLSDEYATYFLRDLAPSDPAIGPPAARTPAVTPQGRNPWDPDDLSLATIESFRLLVIGDQPLASRPPANFRLVYQGRYYDVWQRDSTPQVLAHLPLGGPLLPASVPRCTEVRSFAAQATRDHARLAYDLRPPPPVLIPTAASHPPDWGEVGGDPYSLIPRDQPGSLVGRVEVPVAGRYDVEVAGDISQKLTFRVDGRTIGAVSYELGPPGQIGPVGQVTLTAGPHTVEVIRPGNDLTPGDGGTSRTLGPIVFLRGDVTGTVGQIAPAQARRLCGKPLDWIEIVR